MLMLAHSGQRTSALAQYEACRQALADELGIEPDPETTGLYEQIRDGDITAPVVAPAPFRGPGPVPHLPRFLTEDAEQRQAPVFVAREQELAWLGDRLREALAGGGQVVSVTGGPGRGKTTLLAEFSRRAMEDSPRPVSRWWQLQRPLGRGRPLPALP